MTSLHTLAAVVLAVFAATASAQATDAAKKPAAAQPAAAASGAHKGGPHGQGDQHGKGKKKGHQMSDADCKAMMDKQHGKDGQAMGHDKMGDCPGMKK